MPSPIVAATHTAIMICSDCPEEIALRIKQSVLITASIPPYMKDFKN
jgi:hypothetical protein